jgi:hypothetical protein
MGHGKRCRYRQQGSSPLPNIYKVSFMIYMENEIYLLADMIAEIMAESTICPETLSC